ncbi:type II toxin-antitoxin system VapC family toxin [Pararoseomonas sp. SCSIO 73927]|uniref:type II toxin-antitoxin system VapC family toxin n=1 Tax=Pararoseomonas sp. SCSIO 73927 TaxID=3114537 RepID=UPI0030D47E4A
MISTAGWVLDASVAVKLLVEEQGSDAALGLLGARLLAPDILPVECANVLWRMHRRGQLSGEAAALRLQRLSALRLEMSPSQALLAGALARAMRLSHPIYDCLYLETAARAGLPLVTADRKLAALAGEGAQVVMLSDLPPA